MAGSRRRRGLHTNTEMNKKDDQTLSQPLCVYNVLYSCTQQSFNLHCVSEEVSPLSSLFTLWRACRKMRACVRICEATQGVLCSA